MRENYKRRNSRSEGKGGKIMEEKVREIRGGRIGGGRENEGKKNKIN